MKLHISQKEFQEELLVSGKTGDRIAYGVLEDGKTSISIHAAALNPWAPADIQKRRRRSIHVQRGATKKATIYSVNSKTNNFYIHSPRNK